MWSAIKLIVYYSAVGVKNFALKMVGKRPISMGIILLALAFQLHGYQTTLTGNLNNPDGTGANGYLILSLSQQASVSASCGTQVMVVPTVQIKIQVITGIMQGTPAVFGNDCLLPQNTYYNVTFLDNNGNTVFTDRWVITGMTINIGTIVSVVVSGTTATLGGVGMVLTSPTANQTVAQPLGTNLSVNNLIASSAFQFPQGNACDSSGCNGMTYKTGVLFNGGFQTASGTNSLLYIGSTGWFVNRTLSGVDVNCSGVTDGFQALRTDTKKLEFCIGGLMVGVVLN